MKAIIYDWDGTLCDSIPASFEAMCHVFERCGKPRPTMKEFVAGMRQPPTAFYRDCGIGADVNDEQIWKWYLEKANHHYNVLFNDVVPALMLQRKHGFKICLVSTQRARILEPLLEGLGCEALFDHVLPEADSSKTPLFIKACHLTGTDPRSTYCVGDLKSDIVQANDSGLISVGIIRNGYDVVSVFEEARAAFIISGLDELNDLIL